MNCWIYITVVHFLICPEEGKLSMCKSSCQVRASIFHPISSIKLHCKYWLDSNVFATFNPTTVLFFQI